MAYLIYYQTEREEFKEENKIKLTEEEVKIVFKKLIKHFKLDSGYGVELGFTSGRNHSCAGYNRITLNRDNGFNFLHLCHEVAHTYQERRLKNSRYENWHNKEHKKIMKRMINYCKKKNYFESELKRRLTPKLKVDPSPREIKAKELIKIQEKIVKYEKKVLFYTRKLSKVKRSYKLRLRHFDKGNNALQSPTINDNQVGSSLLSTNEVLK